MEFIATVFILIAVLLFVLFFFSIVVEMIVAFLSGLLLIIILPFSALFDGIIDVIKKIKAKRTKKVKEDPRDGSTVTRVSKADLRDKPVHRPTVWRQKR